MRVISRMLSNYWNFKVKEINKNEKFRNIHVGETCLIFASGASLKYFDFNSIPNLPAITCSYGLLDKRLKKLNVRYNIFSDSYQFYPVVYNPYLDKIQVNYMNRIFKRIISENKKVEHFVSITNSFSFLRKPSNVNYWHHFGLKDCSSVDLAGKFSTNSGALDIMLGVARYMGFSKAILLGCDYLCTPKMESHFYAYKTPTFREDDIEYVERITKSVGDLDVLVICLNGVSSRAFNWASFQDYFGACENYQTNQEIIEKRDLGLLQAAADRDSVFL